MNGAQGARRASKATPAVVGANRSDATSYTRLNRLKRVSARKGDGANPSVSTVTSAGGLREPPLTLQMFDRVPHGSLAFAVPDHSCAPLVRRGEIAIVDIHDRTPEAGGIYLRRCVSCDGRARIFLHEIAVLALRPGAKGEDRTRWFMASHNRPRPGDDWAAWSAQFGPVPMADGPYDPHGDLRGYPWDSLVGRLVGVLADRGAGQ